MSQNYLETGTILIVDDTPNNLKVLSGTLAATGWEILVAIDGEGAIEQAEYSHPDLILLDVMMPGMDGFDTCKHLKANPSTQDIPVIFMTALADVVDKVKGFNAGAVDYITKPFEYEEVVVRIKSQLKIRHLSKQVQAQNLQLQSLAQDLEQRVELRTIELSQTLEQLQQTQVSLIQQEKMSALGELVAGIAHEINNPLSSINGNITYISTYSQDLIELLKLYMNHCSEANDAIAQKENEIEIDFLLEDLPKALTSVRHSAERIVKIVHSVRYFSRKDESVLQAFNIHEGLDSTLMILSHRLKQSPLRPAIQIIKEYQDLPPVVCYPGPLNQVFMNILANAIDAIDEAIAETDKSEKLIPTIWIRTKIIEEHKVAICIADNGIGMSPETKQKLLEPMFTTKSAAKGTGLGLSISRQIVEEQHKGSLEVRSELGKGAEFGIKIPLTSQ